MNKFNTFRYILVGFNALTILLFLFPPVIRENTNPLFVVLYLSISTYLINLGIKKGYNRMIGKQIVTKQASSKLLNFLLGFYMFTFLFKYGYLMGLSPFDIQGMVSRIAIGIANPDLGYMLSLEEGISPVPWSVFFLISVVNDFFYVIFFLSWKNLSKWKQIVVILFVIIDVFFWLGRGTNFGIITMITNALFAYLILTKENGTAKLLASTKKLIIVGAAAVGSVMVFSYLMVGRTGEGDSSKSLKIIETNHQIDYDNIIVGNLPEEQVASYYFIYSYCCQGYEALGKAMNTKPTFTWMCGNNPRLMSLASLFIGYKAMDSSYMEILDKEYGIDKSAAWHSAYLWWANDFTIPGTLLVIFVLSYLCGCAIYCGYEYDDFVSKVIAVALSNILLFLFANNTYLALSFYSSMFLFPYWYFTKIKGK